MIDVVQGTVSIVENTSLARSTFRLRVEFPELAVRIRPGQFVMIRLPDSTDPLLGRPFALYDTVVEANQPVGVDIVYLAVGKMTQLLAAQSPGDRLEIWGPLGGRFPDPKPQSSVALVAGGIGQTPFLAHIRELIGARGFAGDPPLRRAKKVSLYYGVRSADYAAGVDEFKSAGADVFLATDDGTAGYHGFVTDLLASRPRPDHIFACGPEGMLKALARQTRDWNIPCHVSLETPMACGVGICFSCVTRVKTPEGWDYRRVCTEGPIFEAKQLVWD